MTSDFCFNCKCLCKSTIAFLFVSAVIAEHLSEYRIHGNFQVAGMRLKKKHISQEEDQKTIVFSKKSLIF